MFDFNNKEQVTARLLELKSMEVPHMTYEKLCELQGDLGATEDEITVINKYFEKFCESGYNKSKDIFSDEFCTFQWGLRYGEMITPDNGLSRIYCHNLVIKGKSKEVEVLLQYHPDCYTVEA